MVKNRKSGQKMKKWSKNEKVVKKRKIGQKSKKSSKRFFLVLTRISKTFKIHLHEIELEDFFYYYFFKKVHKNIEIPKIVFRFFTSSILSKQLKVFVKCLDSKLFGSKYYPNRIV